MTTRAKRLPIFFVPEKILVAHVPLNVIHHRRYNQLTPRLMIPTQDVFGTRQKRRPGDSPRSPVVHRLSLYPSFACFSKRLAVAAKHLTRQPRASRRSTRFLRPPRHRLRCQLCDICPGRADTIRQVRAYFVYFRVCEVCLPVINKVI